MASADIREGEHVHIHNLESMRARGDWNNDGRGGESKMKFYGYRRADGSVGCRNLVASNSECGLRG